MANDGVLTKWWFWVSLSAVIVLLAIFIIWLVERRRTFYGTKLKPDLQAVYSNIDSGKFGYATESLCGVEKMVNEDISNSQKLKQPRFYSEGDDIDLGNARVEFWRKFGKNVQC